MAELSLKAHLSSAIRLVQGRLVNDLNAIPDDKATVCPGGCARAAVHIVAECGMVNGYLADFLITGEGKRPPAEERDAFLASFDSKEKSVAYLNERTDHFIAVLEAFDESRFGEVTTAVFARPTTLFALCEFPALHMMYHDGQLNFIHTLHGDNKIHW